MIFHVQNIMWFLCTSLQYKNAGMIEMEASLKACRVLISQGVNLPL